MEQEFDDLYEFKDLVEEFLKNFNVIDHYEQESTGEATSDHRNIFLSK